MVPVKVVALPGLPAGYPGVAALEAAQLRFVLDHTPVVLWNIDRDGIVTLCEGQGLAALGMRPGQLVGTSLFELRSRYPDVVSLARRALGGQIATARVHARGRAYDVTCTPIADEANVVSGVTGIAIDVTEGERRENQLLQIARGVSAKTGKHFFRSLVSHLATAMEADYVMVGELLPPGGQVRTIALSALGQPAENFDYDLRGTPCQQVIERGVCEYPDGVQELFPEDHLLAQMAVRAYVGTPLIDSAGKAIGLVAVMYRQSLTDVARVRGTLQIFAARAAAELDRLRVETALAKAKREWTQAMDAFDDPVYIADLAGNLVRANRAFFRLVGLGPRQAIGRAVHELVHSDVPASQCPMCSARQERRDAYLTIEANDPTNTTGRPFEFQIRVLRDEHGEPVGTLMARHDLSRARAAAEALRRVNDSLRLVLESTGEGIFGLDRDLRCTFVNRAAAALLGYRRRDLLGRDMHALVHHSREDSSVIGRENCAFFRAMAEGRSFRADDEAFWRRDGSAIPVEYSANPMIENGAVTGAVVVFRNVADERAMARRMDYLATHDALTGLINRYEFERRLDRLVATARRDCSEHTMCYLDLDQFKLVNDTCGHAAGDDLLHRLSALLLTQLSDNVTLARLGGDEFGLLFERMALTDALKIIGALRELVRDFRFSWEGKNFAIGLSAGVVAIDRDTVDRASAMSQADAACYMAKESGRNRIHVYQADDVELARRHGEMRWVTRIQDAVEKHKLCLYRQAITPVLNRGDRSNYFELLLRMRADDGELAPPGAFLPAAERYGLMPAVDRWVFDRMLQWLADSGKELEQLSFCTINVSGHSLSDDQFINHVLTRLRSCVAPSAKICFELTETAAVANLTRAVRFITDVRQLGCRFALDDFGSGMSSFAYLKNIPVDFLKIDGNFVKDIVDDPVDYAMVDAINKVGHVMGIQTIAEFVESEEVLVRLREIGVDYAQGFALALPEPL